MSRGWSDSTWTNWAGNQQCRPDSIELPLTEPQLQQVVHDAARSGRRVRAVGLGHSFSAIACGDDVLVSLERLNMVRRIDRPNRLVTVQAGIQIGHLNKRLAKVGLAMTNLGDITYQTLAGAVSTGTHGTGLAFTGLAGQIRSMRIVTATGEIVECSATLNGELFHVARVGLGVFGIISELTIEVEPAFNLHAVEGPRPLDEVLAGWSDDIAANDHYEFFWIPGTDRVMTKANRRTTEPIDRRPVHQHVVDKIVGENLAFGAMTKLARLRPSLIPKLRDKAMGSVGSAEYIDESYRVFANARWVKFVEMEYSIAVEHVPAALEQIDRAVADAGIELLFPVEVRSVGADDIPLSTANGRDSGYIAVHRGKGMSFRPYFELVEAIMNDFDGRPHWGKIHFQTAAALAPRYGEWGEFQRVRAELDPAGVFTNDYTDRVLGGAGSAE